VAVEARPIEEEERIVLDHLAISIGVRSSNRHHCRIEIRFHKSATSLNAFLAILVDYSIPVEAPRRPPEMHPNSVLLHHRAALSGWPKNQSFWMFVKL
jgi:hypothetical protein